MPLRGQTFFLMEKKLASIVLGVVDDNDRFDVKYLGITLRLGIKALSPNQIIRIAKQFDKCKKVNEPEHSIMQSMLECADNWNHICKAIAIATAHPFPCFVASAIKRLPIKDVKTLWEVVIKNTDSEAFFFIMLSASKLNLMKAKEE